MQAYHVQTAVANDGSIKLQNLPFPAGESVEVIILTRPPAVPRLNQYPLRGTPITYIDPPNPSHKRTERRRSDCALHPTPHRTNASLRLCTDSPACKR